ncbi:head-tail connector protein [Asticcacaulis sp. AC460]|uniref:head-tail connector protein n=1 Tax=Asticcacaulis sp. AC460 TaxID=1282360 RepID=UPI000414016E|nr:head-tail connector protein [Asticcacaulis sp. AC460]
MLELTMPPASEPVSVATLRAYLRIESADHDVLLAELIAAARDTVEADCGLSLVETHWRAWMNVGCGTTVRIGDGLYDQIVVERGPVLAITGVELAGVEVDAGNWLTRGPHGKAVYAPAGLDLSAVRIDFRCGYAEPDLIPARLIRAIKMLAAHWFENRQAYEQASLEEIRLGYNKLVSGFRRMVL